MANKFDIFFDVNFEEVQKAFKEVEKTVNSLVTNVSNAFKNVDTVGLDSIKDGVKAINKEIRASRGLTAELKRAFNEREKQVKKYYQTVRFEDKSYFDWKKKQYAKDAQAMGLSEQQKLIFIKTSTDKLIAEQQKFENKTTSSFSRIGERIKSFVISGGIALMIFQIRNLTRAVINFGLQFEDTMAGVKAIAGATAEEFDLLSEKSRQLGQNTRFTATEVAQLEQNYARIGFSTQEILDAAEATVSLAAATGEDLAQAAEVAGFTIRGFQLAAEDTQRVVDVMTKSFTSSALNLERFRESMKLIAPIARTVGFSIENATTLIAKLADTGISGSRAGTALRNILSQIRDESSKLTKVLGGTAGTWEEFVELLQLAKERGEEFKDEALSGLDLRIKNVVVSLVDMSDSLSDFNIDMLNAAGSSKELEKIRLDTLQGDLLLLKSAMSELGLLIFDVINPALRFMVTGLTEVVKFGAPIFALAAAFTAVQSAILLFNSAIAKTIALKIVQQFGILKASLFGLVPLVNGLTKAFGVLNAVIIANPYVAVAVAIAAIATALYLVVTVSTEAEKAQERLLEKQKELTDAYEENLTSFETLVFTYEQLIDKVHRTAAEEELLIETIKKLQEQYPRYLKNIDLESNSRKEVANAIDSTRRALERKLVFDLRESELTPLIQKRIKLRQQEVALSKQLILAKKNLADAKESPEILSQTDIKRGISINREYSFLRKSIEITTEKIKQQREEQEKVKKQIEEVGEKYSEVVRSFSEGVSIQIDAGNTLSEIEKIDEKLKALVASFGIETEIKIFNVDNFKTIAGLSFDKALKGTKAFKSFEESLKSIAESESALDVLKGVGEVALNLFNFTKEVKPADLFGVQWIKYAEDFEDGADKIKNKIEELQERQRQGEVLDKEVKQWKDFYDNVLDFQKNYYEKRAKARNEDLTKNVKYQEILRQSVKNNILERFNDITIEKKLLDELIDYEIAAIQKKNGKRKQLAENLRKTLEEIEKRTDAQDLNKEIAQLNKINEFYEDRIAILGGVGTLQKKNNENEIEFLQRLKEKEELNKKDIQYAKELLAIKELEADGEKEITKLKVEALAKTFDAAKTQEALENARLKIIQGKLVEQEKIILSALQKEQEKTLQIRNDFARQQGETEIEIIKRKFQTEIDEAQKTLDGTLLLRKQNALEIARLEGVDEPTDAENKQLENAKKLNDDIEALVIARGKTLIAINKKTDDAILEKKVEYNVEYLELEKKLTSFRNSELENRLVDINDNFEKESQALELKFKKDSNIYNAYLIILEEIKFKQEEAAKADKIKNIVAPGSLGAIQGLITGISSLSSKWKELDIIAADNESKGLSNVPNTFAKINLALQVAQQAFASLQSAMSQFYDAELEKINRNKEAKLKALDEQREAEERALDFSLLKRQEIDAANEIENDILKQSEIERITEKYEIKTEFDKKYDIEKRKIEDAALAKEKQIFEQQKTWAIAQAAINGAIGITSAWTVQPANPILSGILTALIAANTAAQIAVISSQKFATGGFTGTGIGHRDETGERVAGTVHEREVVFERQITMKNLKGLMQLRALLQKGYSMKDILNNGVGNKNSNALSRLSIPNVHVPRYSFAQGGVATSASIAKNEVSKFDKKLDELIYSIDGLSREVVDNKPVIVVNANTIDPVDVEDMTEEAKVTRGTE